MKKNVLKIVNVMAALAISASAFATTGSTQQLCPSTVAYNIDPNNPASTYNWILNEGVEATEKYEIDVLEGTTVNVQWKTNGTYTLKAQETSADGCKGPWTTLTVTVNPAPQVNPQTATLCSFVADIQEDNLNLDLPEEDNTPGTPVGITKWDISVNVPAGVTAGAGNFAGGVTEDKTAIKADTYVNTNAANAEVVYTITPYAGDCPGAAYELTVTVRPEVKAPIINW